MVGSGVTVRMVERWGRELLFAGLSRGASTGALARGGEQFSADCRALYEGLAEGDWVTGGGAAPEERGARG